LKALIKAQQEDLARFPSTDETIWSRQIEEAHQALNAIFESIVDFEDYIGSYEIITQRNDAEEVLLAGFAFAEDLLKQVDHLYKVSLQFNTFSEGIRFSHTILTRFEIPAMSLHDFSLGDPLIIPALRKCDIQLINAIQELHQLHGMVKRDGRPTKPSSPQPHTDIDRSK
jgi:hypothetical protein